MKIEFTILGKPITKKNHSQIINIRGRPALIPSKQYLQYERDSIIQIPSSVKLKLEVPCFVRTVFFMPDERRVDVSNLISSIHDILVKGEVLADDNRKIASHVSGWCETDKGNPRVEISIEVMK